jgi:hypothetical protein
MRSTPAPKKGKEEIQPGSYDLPLKVDGKRPVLLLDVQKGCAWDVDRPKALADFLAASPSDRSPDRRIGWLEQLPDGRWDYGVYDPRKQERSMVELEEKRPYPRKDFSRALLDLENAKQEIYFFVFSCALEDLYADFAREKFKLRAVLSVGPQRLKFSIRGDPSSGVTRGKIEREVYFALCWDKILGDTSRKANLLAYEELRDAMTKAKASGEKEPPPFEVSTYTVMKHFAHKDPWVCSTDDYLYPMHYECTELGDALTEQKVKWEVKYGGEKAKLASSMTLTSVDPASPRLNKSMSETGGAFQTTLNSEYYDLRTQLNESIQREDAEKGRPPPVADPEELMAKFAEEGRKNWAAYMGTLGEMKAKLKDRPLLMDIPYGKLRSIPEQEAWRKQGGGAC